MNNRQLILIIGATTLLALTLAWIIERTQIRNFRAELDRYGKDNSGEREQ